MSKMDEVRVRKVEPVNDINDFKSDHMDSKNDPNKMIKVMDSNGGIEEVPRSEIKTFFEYFNSEMSKINSENEKIKEALGNLIPGYIKSDFSKEQLAAWGFKPVGNAVVILDSVYDANHN